MIDYNLLDFSYSVNDAALVLPMALSLFGFVFYWFAAHSKGLKSYAFNHYSKDFSPAVIFFAGKIGGFFFMGLIPLCLCLVFLPYGLSDYGICFKSSTLLFSIIWIVSLALILIPLAASNASNKEHLKNYPQIRSQKWTPAIIGMNVSGWFLYLLAYEILFRAILLIPIFNILGLWPAIAINTIMYSASHIPKGLGETLGAIPFGIVLCLLTLSSHTIWIAFFVHYLMALSNSFFAFRHQPDMYLERQKINLK